MMQPTILYGVGSPTSAYQAPSSPWDGSPTDFPHPHIPQPVDPTPYFSPLPDPLDRIDLAVQELKEMGFDGINSLRLLAICDWKGRVAVNIYEQCQLAHEWDVLKIARSIVGK